MYMMAIKFFSIALLFSLLNSKANAQDVDFKCFKSTNSDQSLPEINEIKLSWSKSTSASSLLIVKSLKNQIFISELICSDFPKLGKCGLFDDGGEFEILKINSNKTKILLKVVGQIQPEIILPEDYAYLSIRKNKDSAPRFVILDEVQSQHCNVDEE